MNLDEKKVEAIFEAILFAMGDAVEVEKLAAAAGVSVDDAQKILYRMMEQYQEKNRGIRLIELDHSFQLCTKNELYEYLIRVAK